MAEPEESRPGTSPRTRRTRFVFISDTHNCTPKLPKGDVLIHCGDLTNMGSFTELSKQVSWLEKADFECKLVVAGNHDLTLDTDFFEEYGRYFHNKTPQDPARCQELLTGSESLVYLQHASRQVRLTSPTGPRTTFSVFGSPYTPSYGKWAFQYEGDDEAAADAIWADIPLDTDVVVTHGPAHLHRDESQRGAQGCEGLRRALWRVRPKIAACGHIHDARGVERVRWDLRNKHVRYKELGVQPWEDPGIGNEKNSLVDLTAKGGNPLDHSNTDTDIDTASSLGASAVPAGQAGQVTSSRPSSSSSPSWLPPHQSASSSGEASASASAGAGAQPGIGTRGLSGDPRSARSDQSALGAGRLGRRETCFVNCAIQTVSHAQHRGAGPRVLNKPIVVDVDLPVWDTDSAPATP
ncbi:hypothetical protein SLS62_009316 [Diatrype stigma]|uniref:Calcineurin-like phosphoesterase domain-containing protein n=1 Tax=Diatrype stigma TaxID=117547 RepID=A0AAN9UED9_9PEZI